MSKAVSVRYGTARNLPRAIRRGNPYSTTDNNSGAKPIQNSGVLRQTGKASMLVIFNCDGVLIDSETIL